METSVIFKHPWRVEERHFPWNGTTEEKLRFLLHYAILAPSTRNTQPWQFAILDEEIHLLADTSRWLKVADPDQRELYISLGCALENLLVASEHFGLAHQVLYVGQADNPEHVVTVRYTPGKEQIPLRSSELFPMIPERFTNHEEYNGDPIPQRVRDLFHKCCAETGVHLHLTTDRELRRRIDALVTQADATEFANPAFREELGRCIGQGNFGTPWLLAVIGQLAVSYLNRGSATARKDHELLQSSPVLGVLSTAKDDRKSWIHVGQVLERLYLLAASHGICLQPISQIVQVPTYRTELATLLPTIELYPQQPFRLGYAEAHAHHTPRRPLEEVLLTSTAPEPAP